MCLEFFFFFSSSSCCFSGRDRDDVEPQSDLMPEVSAPTEGMD